MIALQSMIMRTFLRLIVLVVTSWFAIPGHAANIPAVDIPYERFVLANGLRVIVHTDRKAPIVSVNIWYHVGSKDEPKGRSGFAHLFEHLMFSGSEHHDMSFISTMEEVGASDLNGTTAFDRTNYFETVPTAALERTLWLESDRMGHLVGAITATKLATQRDVVKNEKRQGDNQPYGLSEYHILAGLFPEGHPYRQPTIGSEQDLDAAALEDVKKWFKTYYGPDNAVLVLAGDIDAQSARPLVEKYFGDIPAGPPLPHAEKWVPERRENFRERLEDQVPAVRIERLWAIPGTTDDDSDRLDLLATILGGTATSRLYRDLVLDRQLVTNVSVVLEAAEIAGQFHLTTDVKNGVDPKLVEARIDAVISQLQRNGPTEDELNRAVVASDVSEVQALEKIGGFSGKAATLAAGELYAHDPGFYKRGFINRHSTTTANIAQLAKHWLANGYYQLTTVPATKKVPLATGVDRQQLPAVGSIGALHFPKTQRAKLSNGIEVVLAERHTVPSVKISLLFDGGTAADPRNKLGTASLSMALLDQGTLHASGLQIAEALERLGATLEASADADSLHVNLGVLKPNLKAGIDLAADIIQNPAFAREQMERVRQARFATIEQEQADPLSLAVRELPPLLFGATHPYGVPLTGSGTKASVSTISRDDLIEYHMRWMRPDVATIFIVGDTSLPEIVPLLEKAFGTWQTPKSARGHKKFEQVALPSASRIVVIDRPGAAQSFILGGYVLRARGRDNRLDLAALNDILGGQFSSRINSNLREDKGWSYGAFSTILNLNEQLPWFVYAPVQTDKTAESLREAMVEIRALQTIRPPRQSELDNVINNNVRALPAAYETNANVLAALINNHILGRPDDYQDGLADRYRSFTLETMRRARDDLLFPDHMIWLVVGDRAKIEDGLKALKFGPVEVRTTTP